jgi:hypothetical protein
MNINGTMIRIHSDEMRISFFYVHTIVHPVPIYTIRKEGRIKEYQPATRPTPELTLLMIAGGAER